MFRVVLILILCNIQLINSYNFLNNQKNLKSNTYNNLLNNNNIHDLLHKNKYLLQPMEAVSSIYLLLLVTRNIIWIIHHHIKRYIQSDCLYFISNREDHQVQVVVLFHQHQVIMYNHGVSMWIIIVYYIIVCESILILIMIMMMII